jgi:acetyltransferase-like isoleucine patch superfamily enzyme
VIEVSVIEIILTREDANTEAALLSEWLVGDREPVEKGHPVCVVETSKASIEIEAPASGLLAHLYGAGDEVELGEAIAVVADNEELLDEYLRGREPSAARPATEPAPAGGRATKRALELAARHGIDVEAIATDGFITAADVEAAVAAASRGAGPTDVVLAGVSTAGVTLPDSFDPDGSAGTLDAPFLESLLERPEDVASLTSEEKCAIYQEHGAEIGAGVVLGEGSVLVAPRVLIGDGSHIGAGALVRCEEVFAVGALSHFGPGLEVGCRRAFLGSNIHAGRSVRFGGGGHRDPWATLVVGDLAFLGDEIFVNVCRPVLLGRETYVTQRSMIVTHNIGHSVLEGFENRFAPVVLEDRAQLGLGAIVYAGCRIGREAIVASGSYVVSDIPAGRLAIGVPAKPAGAASHGIPLARQRELAARMVTDLAELLELRGHAVSAAEDGAGGFLVDADGTPARVLFVERVGPDFVWPAGPGETVVLTLESRLDDVPEGRAVLDLLARHVHGSGGMALDSVREFCRKRGIRFEPGPWRYGGGLI